MRRFGRLRFEGGEGNGVVSWGKPDSFARLCVEDHDLARALEEAMAAGAKDLSKDVEDADLRHQAGSAPITDTAV